MRRKTKITAFVIAALIVATSSHFYMRAPEASPAEVPAAFTPNSIPSLSTPVSETWDAT